MLCSWLVVPGSVAQATVGQHEWNKAAGIRGTNHFVGQYVNDNGLTAYCTDFDKLAPRHARDYDGGHQGQFIRSDGHALTPDENAALAYVLNRWGSTSKKQTAAAVQLSIWAMTSPGMAWGSAKMATFIQQENLPAGIVESAKSMTGTAQDNAGPYSIRIIMGDATESGLVSEAAIAVLGADNTPVGGLRVTAKLTGAFTFTDGSTSTNWTSGTSQEMLHLDRTALGTGTLRVEVPAAPSDAVRWLEPNRESAQRLLTAPVLKTEEAVAKVAALPAFQPGVTTQASRERAQPGSRVHDILTVSAADTGQGSANRWLHQPATGKPLSVTVNSTLWGPLDQKPELSGTVPAGTPKVGTVTTRVHGPGTYETASLTVGGPGYYVWTGTIDPASTKPEQAAQFVKPWQSKFGVTRETTLVPWRAEVETKLSRRKAVVGDTATDLVTVSGLPDGTREDARIQLTMYGPLEEEPRQRATVPKAAPVFTKTSIPAANGQHRSQAFGPFPDPGCYTVVASMPGNALTSPYTSSYGIPEETVCVSPVATPDKEVGPEHTTPEPPEESPKPPRDDSQARDRASEPDRDEPVTPGSADPSDRGPSALQPASVSSRQPLAQTGAGLDLMAAGGIMATGLGLSCGILTWRRRS